MNVDVDVDGMKDGCDCEIECDLQDLDLKIKRMKEVDPLFVAWKEA